MTDSIVVLGDAMWWCVSYERYRQLYNGLSQCLRECDCTTSDRIAMWCAQIGHESLGLMYMEEIADGSAYEGREDLGNIYPGDGCKFKGRGPIMVTGRDNYTRCSEWAFGEELVPSSTYFVDIPEEMASDVNGFHGTTWYWTTQRPMNDYADAHDIEGATYAINGGYNGLEDRTQRYNTCLAMGDQLLVLLNPIEEIPLVGEKVLNYDHSIVPQETGYWCGPASAQVALSCRGIWESEQTLANEMGTDEGGTDYVALIERSLDPRLPEANYTSVDAPHDPPTEDERARLWDGIVRSINSGYAIVMNWVAPPSNYPVGIKGSQSPSYGGGTVFHYVTCVGYDDNPAQRAVYIADSGFQPFGYWMSFDQCATLIPPKAACYANLPHAAPPGEPVPARPGYDVLGYEQLCGIIDPASGYGTGWPQLGINEQGQNLYVVDAVSDILHLLEGGKKSLHWRAEYAMQFSTKDYAKLEYEQEAGIVGEDGYGHGWPQLGGRTLTDAIAHIKNVLSSSEPPPFQKSHPKVGVVKKFLQKVGQLFSRLRELGQRREQDSRVT